MVILSHGDIFTRRLALAEDICRGKKSYGSLSDFVHPKVPDYVKKLVLVKDDDTESYVFVAFMKSTNVPPHYNVVGLRYVADLEYHDVPGSLGHILKKAGGRLGNIVIPIPARENNLLRHLSQVLINIIIF